MPKAKFYKEGDLPEEPEREPSTNQMVVVGNADHMQQAANALEALDRAGKAASETAEDLADTQPIEVKTFNEFGLGLQMNTVRPVAFPQFTTRQQAYRFAAWLVLMAEMLPSEEPNHSFIEIGAAISES